ncbi:MAG: SMC-Scp complex subunit ScpB [Desulfobacterales bacterium]|nr:SMC-Scp complex subunit ScpB [Desulfobacterales bacterium]
MEKLKEIIESLLFVAETALTTERIKQVTTADAKEIRDALQALSDEYESRPGGFYLAEVAGGYQIRTRPEYNEWIKRLIQPNPPRMSKAALETLAIIAYKQPIIRSDIEHIRGVDCGGILRLLLERKFLRVLGRKEIPGRPLIYATTKQFLEVFDLKDLKDLPTPKEIESFGRSLLDESPPEDSSEPESSGDELPTGDADESEQVFEDEDAPKDSAHSEQIFEDEAFPEESAQTELIHGDNTPLEDFTGPEEASDDENPREKT